MTPFVLASLYFILSSAQRPLADYSDSPFEPRTSDALVELELAFGWQADRDHPEFDCTGLVHGIRCEAPTVGQYSLLRTLVVESSDGAPANSMPTQIGLLSTLTDLTIKDLSYTTLPSEIARLTQLTRLVFDNVDLLAPIPRALVQQTGLDTCYIRARASDIGRQCVTCDAVPFCLVIAPVPPCDFQCAGARLGNTDIVSLHNRDVAAGRESGPAYSPPHVSFQTAATTTPAEIVATTTAREPTTTTTRSTIALKTIPEISTTLDTLNLVQSNGREAETRADYRFLYVGVAIAVVAVCVSVGVAVPVLRAYRATTSTREQQHAAPPLQQKRTSEYDRVPSMLPGDHYNSTFQNVV